jgi:hypothetical protein
MRASIEKNDESWKLKIISAFIISLTRYHIIEKVGIIKKFLKVHLQVHIGCSQKNMLGDEAIG